MVGGGNRRDEVIKNTNVFAALESLRKKKKSDKEKGSSKSSKGSSKAEPAPQVFWAPTPLAVKSWADVDEDDDDDYYATTAPPQSVWGLSQSEQAQEKPAPVEESESEEDLLDEGDDDVEEEHDDEPEAPEQPEPVVKKPVEVSNAPKETERQLSKKERKKKELAELDAILANFGVSQKDTSAEDESSGAAKEKKGGQPIGDAERKEDAPAESKSAKKKKKKDKSSKEAKEPQDPANGTDVTNGPEETAGTERGKKMRLQLTSKSG
ncbi:unnamed protein product [Ilex paraguariensis]|uniref:Uncharacterized protein n=1 Tax=Ilex paraguariensis TaxID=185542 RepID=A0ABC8QVQ5_9AQUA